MENQRAETTKKEDGAYITLVGGNNAKRIGGNSYVIEVANEGRTARVMVDLGAVITNFDSGYETAFPDVSKYFDRVDPKTDKVVNAECPVNALVLTHLHEDHVGALVHLAKMGYVIPPMYSSRLTRNTVRMMFHKAGLSEPDINISKPGENIKIGEDMVMEGFMEAHSAVDAMGFHFLTFKGDRADAGIITHGDFLDSEDVPFGHVRMWDDLKDLTDRKPVTHILMESTAAPYVNKSQELAHETPRIGYEQNVQNVMDVIKENPGKVIVSPVISRSFNQTYIDFAAAKELGTKVCLDGEWLKLMNKAMLISGHKEFEDLIYSGSPEEYLKDPKVPVKYIVCTGAFAQGLQEYEENTTPGAQIAMSSATKMALGMHPEVEVNADFLILARQRIINDINGKSGPKMLQLLAERGAVVVMSPGDKKVADFKVVPMQDSGHIKNGELRQYYYKMRELVPSAQYISIHGSEEQLNNTKRVISDEGGVCHVFVNSDEIQVGKDITRGVEKEPEEQKWIGAARVYFNPLEPDDSIPKAGTLVYYHIDENYTRLSEEPIFKENMFFCRASKPGDEDYYANQPQYTDGKSGKGDIMINPYTGKPKKTKSGKFRKENPLKNKKKNRGNNGGFNPDYGGEGR